MNQDDLITHGIAVENIPGLITNETHNLDQIKELLQQKTKDYYSHEEIFGVYCQLGTYIACPASMTFEYCSNMHSLNEWTFSMRHFEYIGGDIWRAKNKLSKGTFVYIKMQTSKEYGVIDYYCAVDTPLELWMRYYFRILDAQPTLNKAGTVVLWTNCKHPYYDRNKDESNYPSYIKKGHAADRLWIGDFWNQFDVIHKIELNNLKHILECRFNSVAWGP